ncbi:hypothetical protein C9374_013382 [Naegleria lovaniensis]|uniref:Uncharacterized protein n=1 Tax=Naegleria lovaniensis TaxID=51637 RepID=A0AA88KQ36_NAELO|nr:uncharacterized protein C9374_013382 [Naegleria lovaniensis]KAG2391897.1 hypothetical protein C9374_013382 [Naegleria lovaniensis]
MGNMVLKSRAHSKAFDDDGEEANIHSPSNSTKKSPNHSPTPNITNTKTTQPLISGGTTTSGSPHHTIANSQQPSTKSTINSPTNTPTTNSILISNNSNNHSSKPSHNDSQSVTVASSISNQTTTTSTHILANETFSDIEAWNEVPDEYKEGIYVLYGKIKKRYQQANNAPNDLSMRKHAIRIGSPHHFYRYFNVQLKAVKEMIYNEYVEECRRERKKRRDEQSTCRLSNSSNDHEHDNNKDKHDENDDDQDDDDGSSAGSTGSDYDHNHNKHNNHSDMILTQQQQSFNSAEVWTQPTLHHPSLKSQHEDDHHHHSEDQDSSDQSTLSILSMDSYFAQQNEGHKIIFKKPLKVKLIISDLNQPKLASKMASTVNTFVNVFSQFGWVHTAFTISNLKFDWVKSEYCETSDVKGTSCLLAITVKEIHDMSELEDCLKILSEEVSRWNREYSYGSISNDRKLQKKIANCQDFTIFMLRKIGVKDFKFENTSIGDYLETIFNKGLTDVMFTTNKEFRDKYNTLFKEHSNLNHRMIEKKHTFQTHKDLDLFVQDLMDVDPSFENSEEYQLLKAFDRGFWLKYRRSCGVMEGDSNYDELIKNEPLQLEDEHGMLELKCPFGDPNESYSLLAQPTTAMTGNRRSFRTSGRMPFSLNARNDTNNIFRPPTLTTTSPNNNNHRFIPPNNSNRLSSTNTTSGVQGLFQHFAPGTFAPSISFNHGITNTSKTTPQVFRPPPQYQAQTQQQRIHSITPISSPILNQHIQQQSPTLITNSIPITNNSFAYRRTVDDDGHSSGFSSHSSLSCNSNIRTNITGHSKDNIIPMNSETSLSTTPSSTTPPVTSSSTFLTDGQSKLDPLACRLECPIIFLPIVGQYVNNKLSIFEDVINVIETPMDIYNEDIDGFERGEKIDNEDEIISNLRKLDVKNLKLSDITKIYDQIILPYIKIQKQHIGDAEELALWLGYKTKIKRLVKMILPFVHKDIHLTVLLLSVLFKQTFNVKYLKFIGDYLKHCHDTNHGETQVYLIELYKSVKNHLLHHCLNYIDTHVKCREDNLFLAYPKFILKYIDVLISFGYLSNCIDMIFDFFTVCCSFNYSLCIDKTFDYITKMLQCCEREEIPKDFTVHYTKLLITSLKLFSKSYRNGSFGFEFVSSLMKFRKACQRNSGPLYQLVYKETDLT